MAERTDAALVAELRAIGRELDLPPAPDLRSAVRARLAEPAPRRRLRLATTPRPVTTGWRARWAGAGWPVRVAAVVAALAVLTGGVVAASPRARAAIADFFHIGSIGVHSGPPPVPPAPRPTPPPRFGGVLPGTRTSTLAAARADATFPVGVPAALGPPDEVLVVVDGRPSFVALRYAPGPGRPPASSSAVAVELDEVGGTIDRFADKYLGGGQAEPVDVGDAGWWIPGPHELVYVDASGEGRFETARLAGRTLIWQQGAVTYRLEGAFSREQALAVARSLR